MPTDYYKINVEISPKTITDTSINSVCFKGPRSFPGIKGVYLNKKKGILAVKFMDGKVYTAKCHEDDTFDVYAGVGICIASYLYGSKKQFHTIVDRKVK